jgi:subtilase family serine protease
MKYARWFKTGAAILVATMLTQTAPAQNRPAASVWKVAWAHPASHLCREPFQPAATATPTGFTPAQIRQAYAFDQLPGAIDGTGQTIAIVDAYGDRYAMVTTNTTIVHHKKVTTYTTNIVDATQTDWSTFCNQFGLPTAGLTVVYPQGTGNVNTSWAMESALDIQWAHAIAPGARILLVAAADASRSSLLGAVDYAVAAGADIVSMSWGAAEYASELNDDAHFAVQGPTFVACSGDNGEGGWWPSTSPYVLSVGGTQLTNNNGTWSESAWSGSGGGISSYETIPVFQSGWQQFATGNMRTVPDVCYQGGPNPGVSVYFTADGGWIRVYGTSVGAPQWAALVALANSARTSGNLNGASAAVYSVAAMGTTPPDVNSDFLFDITSGNDGGDPDDLCIPGYDFVTGLGSPAANNLVPALSAW